MNTARVNIYGVIGEEVTLPLVVRQVPRNATDVFVHINSVGGDVNEGYAIHNYLKSLNANVTTVIEGACYSIATIIALAGGERKMWPQAEIMIHNPWGSISGDAEEIEKYSKWIKEAEDQMISFYSERLNILSEDVSRLMKNETFIASSEALSMGFITEPAQQYKAVAKIKNDNNQMGLSKEDKSWFQSAFAKFEKLFDEKQSKKAMVEVEIVTENGEVELYVDSDTEDLTGKKVFLDEAMTTPAPEGVHTLTSGKEIIVDAEGTITEVRDSVENQEPEAKKETDGRDELMERISAMEKELAAMKEEKEAAMKEKEAAYTEKESAMKDKEASEKVMAEMKEQFKAIKAKFEADTDEPNKGEGDTTPPSATNDTDEVLAYFKKSAKRAQVATSNKSQEEATSSVLEYFKSK